MCFALVCAKAWSGEFFAVNADHGSDSPIYFQDALGERRFGEIAASDSIDVQGRIILDDKAGAILECASLRVGPGEDNKRVGALFIRKMELRVRGDIKVTAADGMSADLHVENLGVLSCGGRIEISGNTAELVWAGAKSVDGGSLLLEGGALRFKVQTDAVFKKVFSSERPALVSLDGELSVGESSVVKIHLEKDVEGKELPAGEFLLVRCDKIAGGLPALELTGVATGQADKAKLKASDKGLVLVVGGSN